MAEGVFIHPTAQIDAEVHIGDGVMIWHQAQVREGSQIGPNTILAKGVYVDAGVVIGANVKVQNYVSIYHGVEIEDGVFIGPHVCFTNDNLPRAITPDGELKSADDWEVGRIRVKRGASVGANSTILPKVEIGEWALVGAGSVVTKDVPDHGLVVGNPARLVGFVCACGERLLPGQANDAFMEARCRACGDVVSIPLETWRESE